MSSTDNNKMQPRDENSAMIHLNTDGKDVHLEMCDMMNPRLVAYVKPNSPDVEEESPKTSPEEDDVSHFDMDVDDLDRYDEAWEEANLLEKPVLLLQRIACKSYEFITRVTKGNFLTLIFLVGFAIYFILAMTHEFGDEGSHRLLGFTVLAIFIWMYPYLERFVRGICRRIYGADKLSEDHEMVWKKIKRIIRWTMYLVMLVIIIYVCVDEGKDKPENMRSLLGLFVFLLISFIFSTRPSKINWHTIFWSLALQFVFACFVLKWKFGKNVMIWLQDRVSEFFKNGEESSALVFGLTYRDHLMIFGAVPLLLFTNAVFTLLYYLGIMQFIIKCIGKTLKFFLHATNVETMAVSASIFLEGTATMLVLRPFLGKMSKSELFAVINGAMSSLGGGYLAILSAFGISLEYLIPAMLISAPATFAICKLMVPEVREINEEDEEDADLCAEEKKKYLSAADAAQTGAMSMLPVLSSVIIVAYTFFTWMTWINHTLGWFGDRVGIRDLSIELISSYVLYPVSWLMGVDTDDCRQVAMLLGYRLGIYNLIAFLKETISFANLVLKVSLTMCMGRQLTEMKVNRFKYLQYMAATNYTGTITKHRDDLTLDQWNMTLTNGYISERSEAVATYALTGFSSALSAALLMGVVVAIVPKRKKWIGKAAIPAIIAGTMANCMTGCFASKFIGPAFPDVMNRL